MTRSQWLHEKGLTVEMFRATCRLKKGTAIKIIYHDDMVSGPKIRKQILKHYPDFPFIVTEDCKPKKEGKCVSQKSSTKMA